MTITSETQSDRDRSRHIAPERDRLPVSAAVARLALTEVFGRLTPARARASLALVDWLMSPIQRERVGHIIEELCERFLDAGVPLDRYGSSTSMVTAEHDAIGRIWLRGKGVTENLYTRPEDEDPEYLASPFYYTAKTRAWLDLWIPETPDTRFGIVASLRKLGIVHYLCVPFTMSNGADGWLTFATRHAAGFSEQDLLTIAFALPALTTRIDSRVGWSTLDKLLRTYVGDEPHKAILAGRAKRGQVSTIEAAMLVADLRDSTGHMANMTALEAVQLLNDLFDCLVPAIETRSGEVLKYLGDGLLAIFRQSKEIGCDAADRAISAAKAAVEAVEEFNRAHPERRPMHIGVALHFGEIAYGNVGSGLRLDFTVVGRDVALASRIATMNAKLHEPILLSKAFISRMRQPADRIGLFPARGFAEEVEIFRPAGLQVTA